MQKKNPMVLYVSHDSFLLGAALSMARVFKFIYFLGLQVSLKYGTVNQFPS